MLKIIKKNKLFLVIFLVGIILRIYKPLNFYAYGHDQDLAGWFIKDILVDGHLRLVGQETSSHGIFIGPLFYYLQIPFYLISRMDSAGAILLPFILGMFTLISLYYVAKVVFTKNIALITTLIYATSTVIVFTDREIAPTMLVHIWTIWFLFAIWRILKGQKYGYIIVGILVGFIWHINLQLIILLPLVLIAQVFSEEKIKIKEIIAGVLISLFMNVPFLLFEVKHGYQQINALVASITTNKDYIPGTSQGFTAKIDRVMQIVYTNSTNIFWNRVINIPYQLTFWILNFCLIISMWKKKFNAKLGIIFLLWQALYILFFSKISLNISEYYLNGLNIIYIIVFAFGVNVLTQNKKTGKLTYLILGLVLVFNLYAYLSRSDSSNGYIARKELISYIKKDAQMHNYPCISLSFITGLGDSLGYRYFTWRENIKTKPVNDEIPVYSIVFPLSKVDRFDKSFRGLGLVLPDYNRYNSDTIQKACEGDDFTVTEPMFGFTK